MAEKLTPQQQQAVDNRGGRLLVSAAAGSGKTKVLVDRLMGYLTDPVHPANIDDFLMITFTKAAAAELRGKIAAKLTEKVAQMPENRHLQQQLQRVYLAKISTVHSFCSDVLREYAYRLDIPGDFRVADERECVEIQNRIMEKLLEQTYNQQEDFPGFRAFVDSQGLGRNDGQVPEIVLKVYESARCHLDPDGWLEHCLQQVKTENVEDASQTVYGQFLIERLQQWLDYQIEALHRFSDIASQQEGYEKQVALLQDTVSQLTRLRNCNSWEELCRHKDIRFGTLTFSKKNTNEALNEQIKTVRNTCKDGMAKQLKPFADSSGQVLSDLAVSAEAVLGLISLVHGFALEFEKAKRSRRILDFGDLEHRMLDLLLGKSRSGRTSAAKEIGSRFREVMVDEYQDSNAVQDAIYAALTEDEKNLFMVGDVKQSIYQFRQAEPGIFLEKYRSFLPAETAVDGQDRKVVLSRNFRSSGGVLEGANDVFRLCMCPKVGGMYYGEDEALVEGIAHVPLPEPEVELCFVDVQQETYPEEAAFVADHIRQMLDGSHYVRDGETLRLIRPEDIAILMRSPGSTGVHFQRALDKVGVRYVSGGGENLLGTAEIGTLHALLQVIHNPRLDIPLVATLMSPLFDFSADDLALIRAKNRKCAFYDVLRQDESEKARNFMTVLQQLRTVAHHESLTRLLEQVLLQTSMEEIYGAMSDRQARLRNIQVFYQLASDFEAGGNRDLGRFLEHLDAMAEKGLVLAEEQSSSGCVSIMSIHKSKGLEFPVVYLCGLGKSFNMEDLNKDVLCHKNMGLGLSAVDHEKRLRYPTVAKRAIAAMSQMELVSEELRVLYVAMTRAKDRLVMTYAARKLHGEVQRMAAAISVGGRQAEIENAICLGDWVLLTALHKTEAGELFALCDKSWETETGLHPWKISVVQAPDLADVTQQVEAKGEISPKQLRQMAEGLAFRYGYESAVSAPSKQTATGLKGRIKDEEVAENTRRHYRRQWRRPSFEQAQLQGKDYGNALHGVMQYIDYTICGEEAGVREQLQSLVERRLITQQQAELVPVAAIVQFFSTELGKKLQQGKVLREFKFSVLVDGSLYDEALAGEQILLQGVVDCALIEPEGITVIDFKSDYVTEETLPDKVHLYASQVQTYAEALHRIYEMPIQKKLLYFFHLGRFVQV